MIPSGISLEAQVVVDLTQEAAVIATAVVVVAAVVEV